MGSIGRYLCIRGPSPERPQTGSARPEDILPRNHPGGTGEFGETTTAPSGKQKVCIWGGGEADRRARARGFFSRATHHVTMVRVSVGSARKRLGKGRSPV